MKSFFNLVILRLAEEFRGSYTFFLLKRAFARPNKLRNRENLQANLLSIASFVSPFPQKVTLFGDPGLG